MFCLSRWELCLFISESYLQLSTLLPELSSIVLRSGANRVYTGTTTVFGLRASCAMMYFFQSEAAVMTLSTIQLAAQCQFSGVLQTNLIPAITSHDTWLSDFVIGANASVVFSSASHSLYTASPVRAASAAFQIPSATVVDVANMRVQSLPTFLDRGTQQNPVSTSNGRMCLLFC